MAYKESTAFDIKKRPGQNLLLDGNKKQVNNLKSSEDRVTLMATADASGNFHLQLGFIHKSERVALPTSQYGFVSDLAILPVKIAKSFYLFDCNCHKKFGTLVKCHWGYGFVMTLDKLN